MERTTIKAKKDLFNGGKCFTKDKEYYVDARITRTSSLMEKEVLNDQGQKHNIGSWWRDFEIVEAVEELQDDYRVYLNYQRVIPRDLFNEAKLLKCMGKLSLAILDGFAPARMQMNEPDEPFQVGLMNDGYLTITNLEVKILDTRHLFRTQYNSQANFPLVVTHDYCDYRVFDEAGEWDEEFLDFVQTKFKTKI